MRTIMGTMADPWTGWLLMRSLETLQVRFQRQVQTANVIAQYLASHSAVERVQYLGFLEPGSKQREIFEKQCESAGATFSFEVHGGEEEAFRILNRLRLIKLAVSLGGTESLAEHPATMTHSDIPKDAQQRMGITPGMIRLSIGVEHPDDIIADLQQALEGARR
jgi:methionine-gamma-lyase